MQNIAVDELKTDYVINDARIGKGEKNLGRQMDNILDRLDRLNITDFARQLAQGFINRITRANDRSFDKNVGISPNYTPEMNDLIELKTSENIALIKSVKNDYATEIGDIVRQSVSEGERSTTLITQIKERGNVSQNRAKFIARDQTTKLNADITELKANAVGSNTYIWSGAQDERERPDHLALEGMYCRYDDPTVYSDDEGVTWKKRSSIGGFIGNVGTDYNCRCVARIVLPF